MEKSGQSKKSYFLKLFFNFVFHFFVSVQDFLDNAKKDFEDRWSKNDKVRLVFIIILLIFIYFFI